MTESILWYVHDHGLGHLQRCRATVEHLHSEVVVTSSLGDLTARFEGTAARTARLRSDKVADPRAGFGPYHYVPYGTTATDRAVDLLDVVQRHGCSTAVVDVSAETAVLCRLAGLRVITLRQSGRRDDAAHRLAHDSADVVWVPQVETLEPGVDAIDRRFCSGAFSRWDGRDDDRDAARRRLGLASGRDVVLVVVGGGGTTFPEDAWRRAGSRPDVEVIVIGLPQRWSTGSVTSWGRVRDPFDFFCAADVVISAAGWATVHDAASLGRPSAVVAEDRPFDEQAVRAAALTAAGLVVTLEHWPEPGDLDAVVRSARSLDPTLWAPHYDGRGAERAAAMIDGVHLGR